MTREGGTPHAEVAFLDMTDVLRYLEHHSAVSGIQRVVVEVAPRLAAAIECEYVGYSPDRAAFVRLDTPLVESLIDAVTHASTSTKWGVAQQAKLLIDSLPNAAPVSAEPGDVLAILGSAWGQPGLFKAVQRLKGDGAAVVVLLYDLIPVLMPGFPEGIVQEFRHYLPRVARLADRVPTISDSTRHDFDRYCHARGWTAPPGATTKLAADQWTASRREKMGLSEERAWERPFALFVSTIEVRKNHILALRCWRQLIERLGAESVPDLVCVGRLGWSVLEFLEEYESTRGLGGKVHVLDSVPESQLAALYRDCLFTVYPSLYEGWGLPVSESFQWGRPVVCARNSSLPEVGLDLARYFENDDLDALVAAVESYVSDPEVLGRDAQRIADEYQAPSWDDVADVLTAEISVARTHRHEVAASLQLGIEYGVQPLTPFTGIPVGNAIARFVDRERRLPLTSQVTSLDRFLDAELLVDLHAGEASIGIVRPTGGDLFLVGSTVVGFGRGDVLIRGPLGSRAARIPKGAAFFVELGSGEVESIVHVHVAGLGWRGDSPLRSFIVLDDRKTAGAIAAEATRRLSGVRSQQIKQRLAATRPGRFAAARLVRLRA